MTNEQITQMAEHALSAFEMTGDKSSLLRTAHEFAIDEFAIRPNINASKLAVKLALNGWASIVEFTKAELEA